MIKIKDCNKRRNCKIYKRNTMIVDKQDVTITMTPQEFNQLRKDFENIMGYISSLEEALEVEKDDAFYTHAPKFRELALFLGVDYRPL